MVLFEDVDGEMVFVAGDDDSGSNTNAKIETRLVRERKYILRIRLYLNWASGDTAVMLCGSQPPGGFSINRSRANSP